MAEAQPLRLMPNVSPDAITWGYEVSPAAIARVRAALNDDAKLVNQAISKAINATLAKAQTRAKRLIASNVRLTQEKVMRQIFLKPAGGDELEGHLYIRAWRWRLGSWARAYISAGGLQIGRTRGKNWKLELKGPAKAGAERGVQYNLPQGRSFIPGAFIRGRTVLRVKGWQPGVKAPPGAKLIRPAGPSPAHIAEASSEFKAMLDSELPIWLETAMDSQISRFTDPVGARIQSMPKSSVPKNMWELR